MFVKCVCVVYFNTIENSKPVCQWNEWEAVAWRWLVTWCQSWRLLPGGLKGNYLPLLVHWQWISGLSGVSRRGTLPVQNTLLLSVIQILQFPIITSVFDYVIRNTETFNISNKISMSMLSSKGARQKNNKLFLKFILSHFKPF